MVRKSKQTTTKKHSRIRASPVPDAAGRREGGETERKREKRNKEKGVAVAGGDREKGRNKGRETVMEI